MSLTALLVVAVAVDTATFLLLPPGAERNPLVLAIGPVTAVAVRWVAVFALVFAQRHISRRWQEALFLPAIALTCIGIGSNLAVIL
jgi:hypothetical protein